MHYGIDPKHYGIFNRTAAFKKCMIVKEVFRTFLDIPPKDKTHTARLSGLETSRHRESQTWLATSGHGTAAKHKDELLYTI